MKNPLPCPHRMGQPTQPAKPEADQPDFDSFRCPRCQRIQRKGSVRCWWCKLNDCDFRN